MSRRRVFITGIGFATPHGSDPEAAFDRMYRGESAIRMVRSGTEDFGADLPLARVDLEAGDIIPKLQSLFMARATQLAMVAAHGALTRSRLLADDRGPAEAGLYLGCGLGGSEALEDAYQIYWGKRSRRLKPSTVALIMANGPASHVSMRFGLQGPSNTYSVACASSTVSIGEAFRAIRDGYLDVALAGGSEAMLNDGTVAAWTRLGVVAKEHPEGAHASSRPFDKERSGFVLAEGAVVLVLESEERAAARGARPIAELIGYGSASDAHHLTEPFVEGQEHAMRLALADARVTPDQIGYLNAHATGTPTGDPVELTAIERVFGKGAPGLAISSTKSMHGHLVGAAGALECAITALALQQQRIPPTAFLTHPDPASDLDLVPGVGRPAPGLELALTNSFAFGGSNAVLVLRRVQP